MFRCEGHGIFEMTRGRDPAARNAGIMTVTAWILAITLPFVVPSAPATTLPERGSATVRIATDATGTPVEIDVDGVVLGMTITDAKCAIVLDGRLALFRTASGAPAKRYGSGSPHVRRAKVLGRSCLAELLMKRAPQ